MSSKNWFEIKAQSQSAGTEAPAVEAFIYDDIGMWGISASDFISALQPYRGQKVLVRINSRGGSVWDGLAIYSYLKSQNVDTRVDGIAASMASIVALAGRKVSMGANAFFMVHNPAGGVEGTPDQITQYADFLRQVQGSLADTYVRETGATPELVKQWMDGETWFSAEQAKAAGLVDEITDAVAFSASVSKFQRPPENLGAIDCSASALSKNEISKPMQAAPSTPEKSLIDNLKALLGISAPAAAAPVEAPELVQVRADLVTARASLTSLGDQVKTLNAQVTSLTGERDTFKANLATVTAQLEEAKKNTDTEASKKAAAITAAQGQPPLTVEPTATAAASKKKSLTEQCLEAKAKQSTK